MKKKISDCRAATSSAELLRAMSAVPSFELSNLKRRIGRSPARPLSRGGCCLLLSWSELVDRNIDHKEDGNKKKLKQHAMYASFLHHFRYLFSPLFTGSSANIPICILQEGDNVVFQFHQLICRKLLQDFASSSANIQIQFCILQEGDNVVFEFHQLICRKLLRKIASSSANMQIQFCILQEGDNVVCQFHFQTYFDQMSSVIFYVAPAENNSSPFGPLPCSTDQAESPAQSPVKAFACGLVIICRVFQQDQCSYGP